jgi:hypothetical protein
MESAAHAHRITVFIDDLDATLQQSDRAACSINRELSERVERQKQFTVANADKRVKQMYAVLSLNEAITAEMERLCENVQAARQTTKDIRRELAKLRMR